MYSINGEILRPLQTISLQRCLYESIFDAWTALIVLMLKGETLKKISMLMIAPDSMVHGANMGLTWVLSAPDGPHVGPMNLAIRGWSYIIRIPAHGEILAALRVLCTTKSSIITGAIYHMMMLRCQQQYNHRFHRIAANEWVWICKA